MNTRPSTTVLSRPPNRSQQNPLSTKPGRGFSLVIVSKESTTSTALAPRPSPLPLCLPRRTPRGAHRGSERSVSAKEPAPLGVRRHRHRPEPARHDPDDIDILADRPYKQFVIPMLASAMDSAVSPGCGGDRNLAVSGCSTLRGCGPGTRSTAAFEEIASLPAEKATRRMQEIYIEPIRSLT